MTKLNYLNASTLIFYDGSSTPPHDGSQSNSAVTLSHSQYGLLWFFFVSGLVISMAFLTLLACFQNYEAVRSGAPTFLIILTFGSTMSFASNLIYIGSISVTTCGVRVWLQLTSYSLMVGSALIKNWRLNHIYNSKVKLKRTSLSLWFWLKAFAVIVFTEQALLIVWVLLAKLRVKNKTISPTQIYRACTAENNVIGYAFWIYNTLLLLGLMRVTYATSHIGHIHSEFSILLISCIVIVLGAILLPSSNDLESSIDALFFQASIIWVGTIVPMTMQLAQRGLSICLDLFNIFEIQVSSKLSNVNPLSRLTQTEPPLPEYQKARSSQLGSRASPKNTIQITGIITCDVVCRMKTAYWSHNWKRGVVAIMRVRSNSYVQFLPARKDLISQPVAYIFNPQKVVVLPLHSSDSTCQMNVNNGRLVLEFLDPAACILFTEQVKTLVSSVQNE
ncbi:hypothetical protein BC830DRAFT_963763 [Chytriomyces sp. MP71]|nr:hypothetical protein BC830DRAFT_963763 [Chytriomyces sp. MP71]